jgi:hypothetical protein
MRLRVAILALVIAVGAFGTLFALRVREANTVFVSHQNNLRRLSHSALEAVLRTELASNGKAGVRAACRPQGAGQLRNPWRCRLSYGSGQASDLEVTVAANGYYVARPSDGSSGAIKGCCVNVVSLR